MLPDRQENKRLEVFNIYCKSDRVVVEKSKVAFTNYTN